MNKIENVKPGTTFHFFGVDYEMVRVTGQVVDVPKRNQWGRTIGGTYKGAKVVVKVNRGPYRGWTAPHYMTFPVGTEVTEFVGKCSAEKCQWRYAARAV